MASEAEARALLDAIRNLRDQIEALDDPGRASLLQQAKQLRTLAEGVAARSMSEEARATSGVGAAPRFMRAR